MAKIETWFTQDLNTAVKPHSFPGEVFNNDSLGNLIGVEVTKDGEPFELTGSVNGYCVLSNGETIPVAGTRSGNKASIVLPQTAYSVRGVIKITLKLTNGNETTTLLQVVGAVDQSVTGNMVNPGSVVQDWSQQIAAALQTLQDAEDNFVRVDTDSQGLTEAKKRNGRTNIDAASVDDVDDLKSAVGNGRIPLWLIDGKYINRANGSLATDATYSATDFIPIVHGVLYDVYTPNGINWGASYKQDQSYNAAFYLSSGKQTLLLNDDSDIYYIRLSAVTSQMEQVVIRMYPATDKTLTVNGAPADAKMVGDKVLELISADDELSAKTDDIKSSVKSSINEYDLSLIENSYVKQNGSIAQYDNWSRTDFLPCSLLEKIHIYMPVATIYNCFYDENKDPITNPSFTLNVGLNTVPIPEGAEYFIISNYTYAMECVGIRSDFIQSNVLANQKVDGVNSKIDVLSDIFETQYEVVQNVESHSDSRYTNIGTIGESSGNTAISFDALPNTLYDVCGRSVGTSTGYCILFVDEKNEIISTIANATQEVVDGESYHTKFTTPERCVKVKYTQVTNSTYNSQKVAKPYKIVEKDEIVPSYYETHLLSKEAIIRGHETDCSYSGDSLVFLTDTHYNADYFNNNAYDGTYVNTNHSIALIQHIVKNTATRLIVFGGDLVNTTAEIDPMIRAISNFVNKFGHNKSRVRYCVGNHEYFTDWQQETQHRPSAGWLYGAGAKYNEDSILGRTEMATYYFDNVAQKIRYFVISCGRNTETTVAQIAWVLSEFEKIPQDYHIVCIGHAFMVDLMNDFRNYHKNIAEALDAINSHSTYTFNGYEYDYTKLKRVQPVCMITGHTHIDGSIITTGGIPCICTTCDSYRQNYEIQDGSLVQIPRTKNSVDEQAFDVIQFDFENRKIYCTRIGYGAEREFDYPKYDDQITQ